MLIGLQPEQRRDGTSEKCREMIGQTVIGRSMCGGAHFKIYFQSVAEVHLCIKNEWQDEGEPAEGKRRKKEKEEKRK